LRQLLVSGRGRGDWDGAGIGSSAVAGAAGRAVGYRALADGSAAVAWAAFGDTNVDGRVNSSDINMILGGGRFGRPGTDGVWAQGDFNYDGRVNSQDLNLLLAAGLLNAPSYIAALNAGTTRSATMAIADSVPQAAAAAPALAVAGFQPAAAVQPPVVVMSVKPSILQPVVATPTVSRPVTQPALRIVVPPVAAPKLDVRQFSWTLFGQSPRDVGVARSVVAGPGKPLNRG